jgi:hypothetical protein
MASNKRRALAAGAVGSIVGTTVGLVPLTAHADTPTMSYGNLRNDWDSNETGLTPGDVASSDFGQVFDTQLTNADGTNDNGQIYAEPTVVNGTLIVANESNNVYGLDPATGAVKWRRNVGTPWLSSTISCGDLSPNVGITSTPVYNPATNAIYFTDKQNDPDAAHPSWYMHAVDPASGAEKAGFPVKIQGTASNDSSAVFNPEYEMQRPGLLLLNGVVYAAFGGHCDMNPPTGPGYRGYVVGVDTQTAAIDSMWSSESVAAGDGAGIWQSGGALMSDGDGRIILTTGNGISPAVGPGKQPPDTLAESVVRLQVNADKSLSAADFFSPNDAPTLDQNDTDLGGGAPVGLPDGFFGSGSSTPQHTMVQQGKDGRLFLLDRDNLGGRSLDNSGALQVLGPFSRQWGHEAVYGGEGGYVYTVGFNGPLRALQAGVDNNGKPQLVQTGTSSNTFGYWATSPIVTSDGTTPGSAVVWVVDPTQTGFGGQALLTAYSAVPDASGNLQRLFAAPVGIATKFSTPVSDDNHVYVGNFTGQVFGFGRPSNSPVSARAVNLGNTPVGTPETGSVTLTAKQAVTISGITSQDKQFVPDTSGLPKTLAAGATVTIPVTFTPGAAGTVSAVLLVNTNLGSIGAVVSGNGVKDGLGSQPAKLDFGSYQPTNASVTLAVRVVNTGTKPEVISSSSMPSGPFTTTGLPKPGSTIPVGGSVDFSVTYLPTTPHDDSGAITIASTSGTLSIPVNAKSVIGAPHLTITPTSLDFGSVPLGQSVSKTFTLTNDGNIPVTISKAKAPNSQFSSPRDPEGMTLGPGQDYDVTVSFAPTANGPAGDRYEITSDSGQGAMYVNLTGVGGGSTQPSGGGNPAVSREAGSDRYGTGVSVSQSLWATAGGDNTGRKQAQSVVLARGDAFPDALAGVPLAAKAQGPLLLTDPKALPQQTLQEIKRVLPGGGTIYVLGGTSAISNDVALKLGSLGYHITRFGGSDRYATALQIAQQGMGNPAKVMLATGLDYADALAAGPFAAGAAATNGAPAAILLTDGNRMDPATAAYVAGKARSSSPTAPTVWAVGGPAVQAARSLPGFVKGFSGADRYATDAQLVQAQTGVPFVGVAVGTNFADALTGGAATAVEKGALITVPSSLPPGTANLLTSLASTLQTVDVFGGPAVIPDATVAAITRSVGGHPA